jgi:hypothetical protein
MEFYAANILSSMSGKVCIGGAGEHFELQVDKPEEVSFKFDNEIGNGARQA